MLQILPVLKDLKLKEVIFTILFATMSFVSFGQLNSTSSQTISTNHTYTGASTISSGSTVTISGGTATFTGTLTVGNGGTGALVVQSGAIVIINGTIAIGTSSNGSVVIQSGGQLIVNPGSATGTAAININSSAATALDIQTGGSVIVNAASTGNTILGMYQTISSNVTVAGSLQIRGGGFKMDGTSKLTYSGTGNDTIVGNPNATAAYFSNSTTLTVGANVNLYINGDAKNDSNANFAINGNVSIKGNYQSGNSTANVTGTGTLSTTGTLDSDSYQGSVFGQRYSCATGPCSGNNLISSSNTNTCSGGTVVVNGVSFAGATYQWLVSTTSSTSGFSNASGVSTSQNYTTTGSSSVQYTYYKRQYTLNAQVYNSNTLTITSSYWSSSSAVPAIGGASSVCVGSTTTLSDALSGGTWSSGTPSVATVSLSGVVTGISAGTTIITYAGPSSGCYAAATKTITVSACPNTWTGVTSTDWNTASNWSLGTVPTNSNNTAIPSGTPYSPIITAITSTSAGITINAGAVLTIGSTGTFNTYGNIINNGTFTANSGSILAFAGNTAQTITGVPVLYNVQINNSAGVSLLSAVTVKGAVSLLNGVLTTNSNLTINFDNGGNIAYNVSDVGSISGNVSGRRNVIARTHYIAAPFSGVTSTQVDVNSPLFYNSYWKMYTKTFATGGWAAVTNTTTAMPLGTGFSLAMPAAAPLILTGTYSHNFSFTTPSYSNAAATKYILIGNPYPTALDWNASSGWTKTNVSDAVYCWNAASSSASSYIGGVGTNGGTQYIPAMQSFMVTTTGTGGSSSVSITNAARVNLQNPSYFRTGSSDEIIRIKLSASNPDQWDDAVIRFNDQATTLFDNEWDAYKIISRGPSPLVYTILKGQTYSINSVSGVDSLPVVDVVVNLPTDGTYTLGVESTDPTIEYVLLDKKLGTDHSLSGSAYVFSGSTTDNVNRFQLQLRTSTTTGTQTANAAAGLQINSSTKGFVIQTAQFGGEQADIELLDMTGNSVKMLNSTVLSTGATYVPVEISAGAYLVKITIIGNVFTGIVSLVR